MSDKAILSIGETKLELPIVVGSEGERAIDISSLDVERTNRF